MSMEKEKRNRLIKNIFGGAYIGVTVVLGALFIWALLDIYFGGQGSEVVFTREKVAEKLLILLAPILIWILMTISAFVLSLVFPVTDKRSRPRDEYLYMRFRKRVPASSKNNEEFSMIVAHERQSRYIKIALLSVGLAIFVYCVVFLAIPENFPKKDVTAEILNMVKFLFPFIALFGIACYIASVYEGIKASKLLPSVRRLAGKTVEEGEGFFEKIFGCEKVVFFSRIALFSVAVIFIIIGTMNGGLHDVLVKAINICTECIGLG